MAENSEVVTIPAAATAMEVSRIVLERAIKAKVLEVNVYHFGGKNGGFRLIPVSNLKEWLKGRKGYHEALKNGATRFHAWGARKSPETIIQKALSITNTNKAA